MSKVQNDNTKLDALSVYNFIQAKDPHRDIGFADEMRLRTAIINNDPRTPEIVLELFNPDRMGEMSKDPQKQLIFGCVASLTLITRNFIYAGMPEAIAFAISDMYLQNLDFDITREEAVEWNFQAYSTFASLRNAGASEVDQAGNPKLSRLVRRAINYIHKYLYTNITLKDVASSLYVTPDYLSHLFRTETGVTFSRFVRKQKIEMAKIMLLNSSSSLAEISNSLSFCSQSYFTKVFHEETGFTPNEYIENTRGGQTGSDAD